MRVFYDRFMKGLRFLAIFLLLSCAAGAARKPNMVIFLADDHGCLDSPVYGAQVVRTPHMEKLAAAGMVFDRAFVASPACGPSRSALFSGLMPARNGAEPNHTLPHPKTQIMVKLLQKQGYEVVAFGKVAHGRRHPELVGFDHWKDARREGIAELVRAYLEKRVSNKPLCLMVGDHRPHVPWIQESAYDPAKVILPAYLVDTKETREHWARYLTDVTGMDAMMAEVDRLARKHFGSEDYLFLYTSDHGGQWPFGKWNLYDAGIRTPMIVRWPGKIKPGGRTGAMVSWVDVMPTLIELAGGEAPGHIDGRSFADVLLGKRERHREVVYTTHSGDGIMNVYPIRAVRTERFKYIRNLRPDCYHSNHSDILRKDGAGAYWDSWDEAAKRDPKAAAIVDKYYRRPAVEFYDLDKDPTEQENLADDPGYKAQREEMAALLDAWMKAQGDSKRVFNEPYPVSGPRPVDAVPQKQGRKQKGKGDKAKSGPSAPVAPVVPAMSRSEIEAGLKSHDRALYIKEGWIRDPYILLGPDDFFYLTGTTPASGDQREWTDPYNTGLGPTSIVGSAVRIWRSKDLIDWESLGTPFTLKESWHKPPGNLVWAPEIHWLGSRWALVHCPGKFANLALTEGRELRRPWSHPMGANLGHKHDPSLFKDKDTWYLLWGNTMIAPLSKDLSRFTAEPVRIDPAGSRPDPRQKGKLISRIGHEGATLRKFGDTYVHFGTAWSTDLGRKGSYNLYYCVAKRITGPYGPRRFAGRFLGHGTPFQTRDGKWWCTAFFNANVPPIPREGIQTRDLSETAQTINQRGTTIVPLEVRILDDGGVHIRAKDPAYAVPGPDEAQKFG